MNEDRFCIKSEAYYVNDLAEFYQNLIIKYILFIIVYFN